MRGLFCFRDCDIQVLIFPNDNHHKLYNQDCRVVNAEVDTVYNYLRKSKKPHAEFLPCFLTSDVVMCSEISYD
jgi:hypothetical protein